MALLRVCFFLILSAFSSIFGSQKVALFNDTSAWYHWGCTGTSTALKEGIEKLGFEIESFPINVTYSLKSVPQFEEFEDRQKFDQFCEENEAVVKAIQNSSAVLITGEGTIHDLRAGPKALLYLAYISKKFFSKHVEIINHSAYPKDDPVLAGNFITNFGLEEEKAKEDLKRAQKIYRDVYSKLDFVAIREPFSHIEMKNIGIESTLSFDCLPLYIRDHYHSSKKLTGKTLLLAGAVAFSPEGAKNLCRYLETMAGRNFKIQVLIGAAAFPSKDDQAFVDFLKRECKSPFEVIHAISIKEWLDTINQATLLVSGRFHHSIAAFCLNTPFITLNSNTPKVHAISTFLGQNDPLLFSDPDLLNQLLVKTKSSLFSPPFHNEMKMAEICDLAERNFDGLRALAERGFEK